MIDTDGILERIFRKVDFEQKKNQQVTWKHVKLPSMQISASIYRIKQVSTYLLSRPEVVKKVPCSTQLSTKFILLINVKMPTIIGILTFISMINATFERHKARNFFICRYFSFYEQLKFRAQLS